MHYEFTIIKILSGCLVCVFKQPFSVFKQHITHFSTLFHAFQHTFSPTCIFTNIFKQQFLVFKHTYQTDPQTHPFYFSCFKHGHLKKKVKSCLQQLCRTLVTFIEMYSRGHCNGSCGGTGVWGRNQKREKPFSCIFIIRLNPKTNT